MAYIAAAVVGTSLINGYMGSQAASNAADAQTRAANQANDLQWRQYQQTREDQAPWRGAGTGALSMLTNGLGIRQPAQAQPQQAQAQSGAGPGAQMQNQAQAQPSGVSAASFGDLIKQTGKDMLGNPIYRPNYQPGDDEATRIKKDAAYGILSTNGRQGYESSLDNYKNQFKQADAGLYNQIYGAPQAQAQNQIVKTQVEQPIKPDQTPDGFGDLNKSFSMKDYQQDPGYQFRLDEGNKAIDRAASARGMNRSGATLKALTKYGQDFASNEYQNAYNRFNNDQSNRFNRLASIAGIGQQANSQLANSGMNYANNASSNLLSAGNAASAGIIGQSNAVSGALQNGINGYMNYNLIKGLTPKPGA